MPTRRQQNRGISCTDVSRSDGARLAVTHPTSQIKSGLVCFIDQQLVHQSLNHLANSEDNVVNFEDRSHSFGGQSEG